MPDGTTFAQLTAELGVDTTKLTVGLKQAMSAVKGASGKMGSVWGKQVPQSIKDSENAMNSFHNTTRRAVKDISRIVTGILISQGFYRLIGTITQATKSVIEFAVEMEKAEIAFTQLLGSKDLAHNFLKNLEDLAAVTPVQIEPLKDAAQQLMAMGFAAKDVIPTLRTLVDTISATGGADEELRQAARVLGKIKAMGRLQAREVRSLATLNIPIQDILAEQLKLSKTQIQNIGQLKIPAEQAVGAIIAGMEKRFTGLSDTMSRTLGGLVSTIKDNLLFIGQDISEGAFGAFKKSASDFVALTTKIRDVTKVEGMGGFLREVFGPDLAMIIAATGKSIKYLFSSIGDLWKALGPLRDALGASFLAAMIAVNTAFGSLIKILATMIDIVSRNKVVVALLAVAISKLVVGAVAAVVIGSLTKAIKGLAIAESVALVVTKLSNAVKFLYITLTAHPVVAILTAVAAAILYIAMSSRTVTVWLERMKNKLAEFLGLASAATTGGEDPAGMFDDWASSISDLGDDAEEAGEQLKKFLAPFDELNLIPEADGAGGLGDMVPDSSFNFPEVPVDEVQNTFGNLFDWLRGEWEKQKFIIFPEINWPQFPSMPAVVTEAWTNALARMQLSTQATWDWIYEGALKLRGRVEGAVGELIPVFDALGQGLQTSWNTAWSNLVITADTAWQKIVINTQVAHENLKATLASSMETLRENVKNFSEKVSEFFGFEQAKVRMGEAIAAFELYWQTFFTVTSTALSLWLAGVKEQFSMENIKLQLNTSLEKMKLFWEEHKAAILITIGALIVGIVAYFAGLPALIGGALLGIGPVISTFADTTDGQFKTLTEDIVRWFGELPWRIGDHFIVLRDNIKKMATDIAEAIPKALTDIITKVKEAAGNVWKAIQDAFKKPFSMSIGETSSSGSTGTSKPSVFSGVTNSMATGLGIASVLGAVGAFGDLSKAVPMPGYAKGGIIDTHQLAQLGEGNKREAVIPLQSASGMDPFAEAIAAKLSGVIGGGSGNTEAPIYVGTLIADENGLRNLNRRLEIIKRQEDTRRGQ